MAGGTLNKFPVSSCQFKVSQVTMKTFWDATTREDVCRRVDRMTPDRKPQWGEFNAAQMLAHLNDAMLMALGELPCASKATPLRHWPLKQLIVYVAPWPKSAP